MRGVENPAEAKAQLTFFGIYGTTEVVPLHTSTFRPGPFSMAPYGSRSSAGVLLTALFGNGKAREGRG
jgi:hypothetical protein